MKLVMVFFLLLAFPEGLSSQYSVIEIAEPFRVRLIQGRVIDKGSQPVPDATFRIQFSFDTGIATKTDKNGLFRLHYLKDGRYEFRVTFPNFNPVVGIVIVSEEADPDNQIEIIMEPST